MGSTWEAIFLTAQHHLDNLTAVVDYNKVQVLGFSKDVLDMEPLCDRLRASGWTYREVDGYAVRQAQDGGVSV